MSFSSLLRGVVRAILGLLLSVPLHAQDAPRFLIERIDVEGIRYGSASVIRSESRLREGSDYAEAELRDAVARVNRLPFVIRSDFRLEKGSERGKFTLVVIVDETKPLFVTFNSLQQWIDTVRPVEVIVSPPGSPPIIIYEDVIDRHGTNNGAVGGRWFAGANTLLTVTANYYDCGQCRSDFPSFSAGYTQYDLFGSRASVSALLQYRNESFEQPDYFTGDTGESFEDHLALQLSATLPLFGNEALRATYYRQTDPYSYPEVNGHNARVIVEKRPFDQSEVAWLHDTTDDPIFPTKGSFIKAAAESLRITRLRSVSGVNAPYSERQHDVRALVSRYWQLTSAQSVSGGVEYQTRADQRLDEYTVRAGYALDLTNRGASSPSGEVRLELDVDRIFQDYSVLTSYSNARLGVAFRSAWGIARLGFQYVGWRDQP